MRDDVLKKVLDDYKLGPENALIYKDGKRGKAVRDREAYNHYLDRSGDEDTNLAEFKAAAVAMLQAARAAARPTDFPIFESAERFAEAIAEKRQIKANGRGRNEIRGTAVRADVILDAIKSEVHDYNRNIPKIEGKPITAAWSVEHVTTKFSDIANMQAIDAVEQLRRTLVYDEQYDPNERIAAFLTMLTVDVTPLNVAVLNQFMGNVKRMIYRLTVADELIPNFHGAQGTGKTYTLSNWLSAGLYKSRDQRGPMHDVFTELDFSVFSDPQCATAFANYYTILISDPAGAEGHSLSPREVEMFKAVTGRPTLDSRQMYAQKRQVEDRIFSLVCNSNRPIAEVIRDPSGARRLYEYTLKLPKGDRIKGADDFDYLSLWKSVNENAKVPALYPGSDLWVELQDFQKRFVPVDTLKMFLDQGPYAFLPETSTDTTAPYRFTVDEIFTAYKDWIAPRGFDGYRNVVTFAQALHGHELKSVTDKRKKTYLAGNQ